MIDAWDLNCITQSTLGLMPGKGYTSKLCGHNKQHGMCRTSSRGKSDSVKAIKCKRVKGQQYVTFGEIERDL